MGGDGLADLTLWAAPRLGLLLLLLSAVVALLALGLIVVARRLRRLQRLFDALADGAGPEPLQVLLERQLERLGRLEGQSAELTAEIAALAHHDAGALRHVGLVRYDAFADVGGRTSFALAVLDDRGHGFLLNGLATREGSRIYAKPVVAGASAIELADEEREALRAALDQVETARRAAAEAAGCATMPGVEGWPSGRRRRS